MAKSKLSSHLTKQINLVGMLSFQVGRRSPKKSYVTHHDLFRVAVCTDHEIASLTKIPVNETHGMDGLMAYEYIKDKGIYESNSN